MRIKISPDRFLLFAELVDHCKTTKKEEIGNLQDDLKMLSLKVINKTPVSINEKAYDYYEYLAMQFPPYKKGEQIIKYLKDSILRLKNEPNRTVWNMNEANSVIDFEEKIKESYKEENIKDCKDLLLNKMALFFPLPEENEQNNIPAININTRPTDQFANSKWFFYYHEYIDDPKTPYTIISRLVLEIVDNKHIKLYERREKEDFTGSVTFGENDNILIIQLTREITGRDKRLELRIIIPNGTVADDSLFLGQYMDFETGEKIVSGTFVLENIKSHSLAEPNEADKKVSKYKMERPILFADNTTAKTIQVELVYYSDWKYYIPKTIANYLSHKWKNHTKTKPINNATLQGLGNFIEEQDEKPFRDYKFNTCIEYDFFIIAPGNNVVEIAEKDYYKEINKYFFKEEVPSIDSSNLADPHHKIYESSDAFKKIGINRLYYPPRVFLTENPTFSGEQELEAILEKEFKAMRESRFVLFIAPHAVCDWALVKLGWAMQQEKPTYIFPQKENVLPKLIERGHTDEIISATKPLPINGIIEYLAANHRYRLKAF